MNAEELEELHRQLAEPDSTEELVASKGLGGGSIRLAKMHGGEPAFALVYDAEADAFGTRLRHVVYEPRVRFLLDSHPRTVALFQCRDSDRALRRYFFRAVAGLLSDLSVTPDFDEFDQGARGLIELFDSIVQPGTESVQGVWAELLLISLSTQPNELMAYWHTAPTSTYDFASAPHRLEVKSTVNQTRVHRFALEQLEVAEGGFTAVASMCLREDEDGIGVDDLVDDLVERLTPQYKAKLRRVVATALGQRWRDAATMRFSLEDAVRGLRFFSSSDVPSVTPGEGVSGVKFNADLANTPPLSLASLPDGPLFTAVRTTTRIGSEDLV